jgi:hypothetical protein
MILHCGFYVKGVRCKLHVDHCGPCEPRPDATPPKEVCTCPEGLETCHGPAMKRFGRGFDRDCPVHGMEAMGLAPPPSDAAPVKDDK